MDDITQKPETGSSNIIVKESLLRRIIRRIKYAILLATGLVLRNAINYPFDYVVYPIVLAWLGSVIGGIVLLFLGLFINILIIRAYDWSKTDWFLIEKLKSVQDSDEKTLFVRLLQFFRRSKVLTFLILCLDDPVTVTLYFRKGNYRYNGMTAYDWKIFLLSNVFSNLYWIVGWSLVIEFVKFLMEKF